VSLSSELADALAAARAAEKDQAMFYRALAAQAELAGDAATAERLNGLHADEQHHLSRLTARLVELGRAVEDLGRSRAPEVPLDGWESVARHREREEVARYEAMLRTALDEQTRAMILEFLEAERRHAAELGGKWMEA